MEEIEYETAHNAWAAARKVYHDAQMSLAKVRALNFDEIALKATAAMAFERGFGDKDRRPLRVQNQMVAFGVAWDAVLLAAEASEKAANH
ncbi:hypothetical protein [Bradyrhizobium sp. McL0615]|uniref:hypothetical protein n=1 Tax=Bradyrhizobium sp. McL0615 TaxID=3415673 RepID=UPI003CF51C54